MEAVMVWWTWLACTGSVPTPEVSTPVEPPPEPQVEQAVAADFHHLSQGSESLSLLLFQHLERADSTELFATDLERFGLIPDLVSPTNPYGMPIGLTVRTHENLAQPMVGQTCAACHTGRIEYEGRGATYDGVPNLFRSTDFFQELSKATQANFDDRDKLERLLKRILGAELGFGAHGGALQPIEDAFVDEVARVWSEQRASTDRQASRQRMRDWLLTNPHLADDQPALDRIWAHPWEAVEDGGRTFLAQLQSEAERRGRVGQELARWSREARLSFALLRYVAAYGGTDAVPYTPEGPGRTDAFGRVRAQVLPQLFGPGVVRPLTAPTSVPPLFDIQTMQWLHTNGNTADALERNVVEAIGSGAVVDAYTHDSWVQVEQLATLEALTYDFVPPPWPDFLPPIDSAKAARGEALFAEHCAWCHGPRVTQGKKAHPRFAVELVGTDPNHARNFAEPVQGRSLPDLMTELAVGVKRRYYEVHGVSDEVAEQWQGQPGDGSFRDPGEAVYAARPLTAVWSTAPYLHNGSVPTLDDLLRPVAERPRRFPLGHREYDPVKVGYRTDVADPVFVFDVDQPVLDADGQPVPGEPNGNSNAGHVYGTELAAEQRAELVEYLKTL
jgi:hypothetical protein